MDRVISLASLAISVFTFFMCLGSVVYVEDKLCKQKPKEPEKGKGPIYFEEDGTVFKPRI